MSSEQLHERREMMSRSTLEMHRAITSLMEELEAVDWYQQRADATEDASLKKILEHNRDEEMEHAAMVLEWIRRNSGTMDGYLRKFLFSDEEVVSAHHEE